MTLGLADFVRGAFAGLMLAQGLVFAQGTDPGLKEMVEQNRRLMEQLKEQQQTINQLALKVAELQKAGERRDGQLQELREGRAPAESARSVQPERDRSHELRLSGEAGMALFKTGVAGSFPKAGFRLDDTKLFVEAPVLKDTYFFGEINLTTREADDNYFELGELYVDFENVSGRMGGPARWLNVRAGRIYSPFGEEYQVRGPVANPLISHSLADVWGVDNGVEAYGTVGAWQYAFAVQNGGNNPLKDFNADKAVVARVGWDPATWLHVSASAMRTGELRSGPSSAPGDFLSSLWFGNGFFRALGSTATTSTFWANLVEGDAALHWKRGRLLAAVGGVKFSDNDRSADNSRHLRYGLIEATQSFTEEIFGAARYSWIEVARGYPLVGWGGFGRYFFSPSLTTQLRRTSIGLGYRFGTPLVLKVEYTRESGRMTNGASRDQEDFLGGEVGLKF